MNVVVSEGAAVQELLPGKDELLSIRPNALFVLDLLLDVFDRVRGFDIESDGFPCEGLYENLHAAHWMPTPGSWCVETGDVEVMMFCVGSRR